MVNLKDILKFTSIAVHIFLKNPDKIESKRKT